MRGFYVMALISYSLNALTIFIDNAFWAKSNFVYQHTILHALSETMYQKLKIILYTYIWSSIDCNLNVQNLFNLIYQQQENSFQHFIQLILKIDWKLFLISSICHTR